MKKYFASCNTLDDAKLAYKTFAKILHPDINKSETATADFQEMCNQFDSFQPKKLKFEKEMNEFNGAEYRTVLEQLWKLDGVIVEICGSYLWLSGETKKHLFQIKAIESPMFEKPMWAKNKEMWFFKPKGYKSQNRKVFDINQIRAKYGSIDANERKSGTEQKTKLVY
jgi:hypothetical protein